MMKDRLSPTPFAAEVKNGPPKPISDLDFVVKNIMTPWDDFAGREGILPVNHPLVAALIEKYELPSLDRYIPAKEVDRRNRNKWIILGHRTVDEKQGTLEKFGGVLGDPLVTTFYDPAGLKRILNEAQTGHTYEVVINIFVAPGGAIIAFGPGIPLQKFKPGIKLQDIPPEFLDSFDGGSLKGRPDRATEEFEDLHVLPLDWRIGVLKI